MDRRNLFKYCFGCDGSIFTETVIVSPILPVKKIVENCEVLEEFKGSLFSGVIVKKDNIIFTVIRCGMGSNFSGDAILLLEETSVKDIVFIGTCGGLKECKIGDILVCEKAFDGEGFSQYHKKDFDIDTIFSDEYFAGSDVVLSEKLKKFLENNLDATLTPKSGNIFTIGSLLAEKPEDLKKIEEKGFLGVDLELSAIYNAAHKIHRRATGVMYVRDLPLKKPLWDEALNAAKSRYNREITELAHVLIDFVVQG